ncbi:LLM class flavin-dependent oxidoreductase [Paracraurococcus lichenis]|uniref:LLM class flavin-dependent oxidoreductase n=1 Tax=Paracraurococcus lichenis TaxID=3064888 RepID=A0ABT9E5L7_9PROT|nr:LLM class flavin-dependent oxidoreductase [Paracraurococcus sp. LOR1-02]MDO9711471.1 LLM class flavin-dependent oxidoreductase [Paracraurococcus sp. LOR1-02]
MTRQLHLNLFIHGKGHHEAAWRHPSASPRALTDIAYYRELAQAAEAAAFDSIFFADHVTLGEEIGHAAKGGLEPITTLAALAGATSRIGLIATASTSFTEPYNLARQFASLDHISGGRIGWNVVTTWVGAAAGNYGQDALAPHAERYARAEDFLDAVTKLWDSWDDAAVLEDRAAGRYADPALIRRIDHQGPYYRVTGPLNVPRGPQGRPVLVQAGSSATGKRFAARHAEAVFTAHLEQATARDFAAELKGLAASFGRDPAGLLVLPGISPVIGSTEAEAQRLWRELNDLTDAGVGLSRLSARFGGHDFSHLPLDRPLTPEDFPDPAKVQAAQSRAQVIVGLVARERPTLLQLLHGLAGARGHFTLAGTPEQVAAVIEDWFRAGAADGFNLMPPILPQQFSVFVEQVVPLLRRRGLFRTEYGGRTLRGHYGLARPANHIFAAPAPVRALA